MQLPFYLTHKIKSLNRLAGLSGAVLGIFTCLWYVSPGKILHCLPKWRTIMSRFKICMMLVWIGHFMIVSFLPNRRRREALWIGVVSVLSLGWRPTHLSPLGWFSPSCQHKGQGSRGRSFLGVFAWTSTPVRHFVRSRSVLSNTCVSGARMVRTLPIGIPFVPPANHSINLINQTTIPGTTPLRPCEKKSKSCITDHVLSDQLSFDVHSYVTTPVLYDQLYFYLDGYDEQLKMVLVNGFKEGFDLGYRGTPNNDLKVKNLKSSSENPGIVREKINKEQGDLDDARESTAVWCWNVKSTKFRGGHLGSLVAILDWQWVLDKTVLYIW